MKAAAIVGYAIDIAAGFAHLFFNLEADEPSGLELGQGRIDGSGTGISEKRLFTVGETAADVIAAGFPFVEN